jgi:hypothetical protein
MRSNDAERNVERRRASSKVLLFPALVAAVALVVWWTTPSLGALSAYELEIVTPPGARQVLVASREEVAHVELGAGRELSLLLRPRGTSTARVDARVFLQAPAATRGGPLTPLTAVTEHVSPAVLRVALEGSALPKAGRLLVFVGRSGLLPDSPAGSASHGRDWQRFDLDVSSPTQTAP